MNIIINKNNMALQLNETILDRTGDGIIAYTWRKYIDEVRDNDMQLGADFLLRCPMTKVH